jgi:3-oxoadipate enol-lactonase
MTYQSPLYFVQQGYSGPVLLFVHGFPMCHEQWLPQIAKFSKTCRVIAPDLRGLGKSSLKPGQTQLTIQDHVDDLVQLLDHLNISEPVVLFGLSMGGYIAFQMIKRYPERLRGLVLCHTRVIADTPEQAAGRKQLAQRTLEANSADPVLDVMVPRLLHPKVNPSVVEQIRSMGHQATAAGLAANLHALATREDASDIVPNIKVPTIAISGDLDAISPPAEMSQWALKIPGAEFISIAGVGHVSPLENPQVFNEAVLESPPW